MNETITVTAAHTEELDADTRAAIIHVCRTAFQEDDFLRLFSYIRSGGTHVLAYHEQELVGHAVATTRWRPARSTSLATRNSHAASKSWRAAIARTSRKPSPACSVT